MTDSGFLELFPYAWQVAGWRAARLVALKIVPADEQEDAAQELVAHLWIKYKAFDSRKSSAHTFASMVMTRKAISLGMASTCEKRDVRRCRRSLDEPVNVQGRNGNEAQQSEPLWATIPVADDSWMHQCTQRIDIQRVLEKLPRDLREIAQALSTNDNRSEAARAARVSRTTMYRKIAELRQVFMNAGLQPSEGITTRQGERR